MIMLPVPLRVSRALHLDAAKWLSYRSRLCFRFRVHTCLRAELIRATFILCPLLSYILQAVAIRCHFNSLPEQCG